jgi:putative addiction module antidote
MRPLQIGALILKWLCSGQDLADKRRLSEPPFAAIVITIVIIAREAAMVALKLRKVGHSIGVLLPREALAALHVSEGDTIFLTEAADGFRLTPYDPEFERQMTMAQTIMKNDRNMLRELAKK